MSIQLLINNLAEAVITYLNEEFTNTLIKELELNSDQEKKLKKLLCNTANGILEAAEKPTIGSGSRFFLSEKPNRRKPAPITDKRVFLVDKFPIKKGEDVSKSTAVIGDLKNTYVDLRNHIKAKKWGQFNDRLSVGKAWVVWQSHTPALEKELKKRDIEYKRLDFTEYEKIKNNPPEEIKKAEEIEESEESEEEKSEKGKDKTPEESSESDNDKTPEESSESEEEESEESEESSEEEELQVEDISKKDMEVFHENPSKLEKDLVEFITAHLTELKKKHPDVPKKKAPVKKTKAKKKGLTVPKKPNKWGNLETKNEGFVIMPLPHKKVKGKMTTRRCIVGSQNPTAEKKLKGLLSVIPLDEDDEKDCHENGWPYLTEEKMEKVRKLDKDLYHKLEEMKSNTEETDEETSDEEEESSE